MWQHYYQPETIEAALTLLRDHAAGARVVAGGSDVLVELGRDVRTTQTLIDITRLPGLKYVRRDGDVIRIGALATHNDVVASPECVAAALPLAQACWEIGAPQIRTRATVAGNLVTASPANDTITPLLALDAEVALVSAGGERAVPLRDFYPGFRRTALRSGELLREVRVPALRPDQRGLFLKLGLRRAQAISVINIAIVLTLDGDVVREARVAMGCLAPTVVRATTAEGFLVGRRLDEETCLEAGQLAHLEANPIGDVRGSAEYRLAALRGLVAEGLRRIAAGREREGWPERVVLLETTDDRRLTTDEQRTAANGQRHTAAEALVSDLQSVLATVNGTPAALDPRKSLMDALREDAGLTGTKVGCSEGECGACTVWLDGQAVMSCLTPAAQAHGAHVITIEGLAGAAGAPSPRDIEAEHSRLTTHDSRLEAEHSALATQHAPLHPLQRAFIECGAVQCGYCIPGMLMAGAKLLEERANPSDEEIRTALSGNICRCTGYRKILDAVRAAAAQLNLPEHV
ncbi:MAG: hypothetical protein RLZZ387_3064 [Chloroflexota bacterium]|jgi:carbon-monoxide dehydrogenase medium subunit